MTKKKIVKFSELPVSAFFGLVSEGGSVSLCQKIAGGEYYEGVRDGGKIIFQNHSYIKDPNREVIRIYTS